MGKHALLLSGGVDKTRNFPRYKNDLEWVYKVLLEDCNYPKTNIKVFYADGKNLLYETESVLTARAEKKEVIRYLEEISRKLQEEDTFAFIVSNHGAATSGGCIYLWGEVYIEFDFLVQLLNQIKAKKYIILGECYGGNILDWKIENACILTANKKGEVSYTNPLDMSYDEFIRHFFSFIHKEYPDGKGIPQGENDVRKAYEYACDNDVLRPETMLSKMLNRVEIPQMQCDFLGEVRL